MGTEPDMGSPPWPVAVRMPFLPKTCKPAAGVDLRALGIEGRPTTK